MTRHELKVTSKTMGIIWERLKSFIVSINLSLRETRDFIISPMPETAIARGACSISQLTLAVSHV